MREGTKTIGIVGGVGPYAGLDLNRKVFEQTSADEDQGHLQVILISRSDAIPDRTEFLSGRQTANPGVAIAEVVRELEAAGAEVLGIPCNTAHAPEIFGMIQQICKRRKSKAVLLNMIEEVAAYLKEWFPGVKKVGILGTNGTVRSGVYTTRLKNEGFEAVYPCEKTQREKVHRAVYDRDFGIKARGDPVTDDARGMIHVAAGELVRRGGEVIVLACSELPLAIKEKTFHGKPVIDATRVLARALVRAAAPWKLREVERD